MFLKTKKLFTIIGASLLSLIVTSCTIDGFIIFSSGNRIHAIVLAKDNQVQLPKAPFLEDYIFYGWYTEEEFVHSFDPSNVDEIRRVYARFIKKTVGDCKDINNNPEYGNDYYRDDSYYYDQDIEIDLEMDDELVKYYSNIRLERNNYGTYTIVSQIIHRPIDSLILPTFHNEIKVTHIANNVFEWRNINELVLPRYIKKIGNNAFRGLNVSKLLLDNYRYLEEIGNNAFSNSQFTSLIIENAYSLINISNNAFRDSYQLTKVSLLNLTNLREIGNNAFSSNLIENLTLINLPSIKEIGNNAFANSLRLNKVTLENVNPNLNFGNNSFFIWIQDRVVTLIQENNVLPSWWNIRFEIFGNSTSFIFK